jgi:methylated-DNA-[protein]-cysteine S-methyltransferase
MSGLAFSLFDTAIGMCGIVWRGETIVGAALPGNDADSTRAHLARRFPDALEAAPPGPVGAAIDIVVRMLSGEALDVDGIAVDLSAIDEFDRKVLEAARAIPRGEVRTYGELAAAIGQPGAARAVGAALGRNPIPIIIPCHRILAAAGRSGGFSAPGGTATKFRMLAIEKARRSEDSGLFEALPLALKPA